MATALPLSNPVLLTADHDLSAFDCGIPAFNNYLRKYAWQNIYTYRAFAVFPVYGAFRGAV